MDSLLSTPIAAIFPIYSNVKLSSFLDDLNMTVPCAHNCSGHGECHNGVCVCEVQFYGENCREPNTSYFIAFATFFYIIGAVSIVQLVICIRYEYLKMKSPSIRVACRITTQKLLYVLIFMASIIRGLYFSMQGAVTAPWSSHLMTAYYPIMLTGSSLIVCFWAEVFHIPDYHTDKPRFLSKSFLGFLAFNIITYSLLMAELLLTQFTDLPDTKKELLVNMFYSCYAVLLLVVVIFFLFYGVEVYFKIRGGFTTGPIRHVDTSQWHQSRFGLTFQACMLLITVCFLLSEILGQFWKNKVPVLSRNCHDVLFRVVELVIALWFPCVLWNCISPEQLWILNPGRLLKKLEAEGSSAIATNEGDALVPGSNLHDTGKYLDRLPECWICYDMDRTDVGPLIQPCLCRGDMGAVHHDCLRKWLVEQSSLEDSDEHLRCKVCNQPYGFEHGQAWLPNGFTVTSCLYTVLVVSFMGGSVAGAWHVIRHYQDPGVKMLVVGGTVLVQYICLKFLGFNAVTVYQRARMSAVKILGRRYEIENLATSANLSFTITNEPRSSRRQEPGTSQTINIGVHISTGRTTSHSSDTIL